jgi:ABC-type Fe3+-hydroxamate transport system substrate-binding protein
MLLITVLTLISNLLFSQDIGKDTVLPKRIAALSPAIVQTLVDIGLENRIACAAGPLDKIKLTKDIASLGLYHKPNVELIIKCTPDLIITTYAGTPPGVHKKLKRLGYNLILEKPETISSIKDFIIKISKMFMIKEPRIVKEFDRICITEKKRTAIMIVGLGPVFAAGKNSFVSDAINCAGYHNMLDGGYKRMSIEKIISLNPDNLIIAMERPEGVKDYKMLKKIFKDRTIIIDPTDILEPSTRILKGIKTLQHTYNSK